MDDWTGRESYGISLFSVDLLAIGLPLMIALDLPAMVFSLET